MYSKKFFFIPLVLLLFTNIFAKTIEYKEIVTVGNNKAIAILPEDATRENLTQLAYYLDEINKDNISCVIYIYDQVKAAMLYEKVANAKDLTDAEGSFYDKHFVALYWKVPEVRYDFTIMLNGVNGEKEVITFDKEKIESSSKQISKTNVEGSKLSLVLTLILFVLTFYFLFARKRNNFTKTFKILLIIASSILILVTISEITQSATPGNAASTRIPTTLFVTSIMAFIYYKLTKKSLKKGASKRVLNPDEPLPIVEDSYVLLKKGEKCHFYENATYYKVKNVVVGYKRNGGGVSSRLFKGVYLHSGSSSSEAIRSDVAEKTEGIFAITNKRIIFNSNKISFDKKIDQLSSITPYSDGLGFHFSNTQHLLCFEDPEYVYSIIARIINESED